MKFILKSIKCKNEISTVGELGWHVVSSDEIQFKFEAKFRV